MTLEEQEDLYKQEREELWKKKDPDYLHSYVESMLSDEFLEEFKALKELSKSKRVDWKEILSRL
jgi:hypothetical protein